MKKYLLEYCATDGSFDYNPVNASALSFSRPPFREDSGRLPVALVGGRLLLDSGFRAFLEHLSARNLDLPAVCSLVNLWICNAAESRRLYFERGRVATVADADLPHIVSLSD